MASRASGWPRLYSLRESAFCCRDLQVDRLHRSPAALAARSASSRDSPPGSGHFPVVDGGGATCTHGSVPTTNPTPSPEATSR